MGVLSDLFENVWREFVTAGVPSSGEHEPEKSEIRAIGAAIEQVVGASLGNVDVAYATQAELFADLAWDPDSVALVYADADSSKIDLYLKTGASGAGAWTNTLALQTALAGIAQPYVDAAETARDEAENYVSQLLLYQQADNTRHAENTAPASAVTPLADAPVASGAISAARLCVIPRPRKAGVVESIEGRFTTAGAAYVFVMNPDLSIRHRITLAVAGAGNQTFVAGLDFDSDIALPEGGYIALYSPPSGGGGALFMSYTGRTANNGFLGYPFYLYANLALPNEGDTPALTYLGTATQFGVIVNQKSINAPRRTRPKPVVQIDTDFPAASIPAGLWQEGGWAFAAGEATSGAASLNNGQLKTLHAAHGDENIGVVDFQPGDAASIVAVTRGGDSKTNAGAAFSIDVAADSWKAHSGYEEGNSVLSAALETVANPFTNALSAGRRYQLRIERTGAYVVATLTDLATGEQSIMDFDAVNSAVKDELQTKIGFSVGMLGVGATTGSVKVHRMYSADLQRDVRGVIISDSIFRGNGATYADTMAQRIKADFGGQVLVSALDGSNGADMIGRLNSILDAHSPEWVYFMTGTNLDFTGGSDATSLARYQQRHVEFLALCQMHGCEPIIGYCPPTSGVAPRPSFALHADYIAYLQTLAQVRYHVRLDLALSLNNDGVNQDPSKYTDDAHPNDAGQLAMYVRTLVDAPILQPYKAA